MGDSYRAVSRRLKVDRPEGYPPGGYPGPTIHPATYDDPARLAIALQAAGWMLRHEIIWDKGWVRPETARSCHSHT